VSRVQLALNVADIDEAIEFYSKLLATEPAKVRPGYANFIVGRPRPGSARRRERRHLGSGRRSR
jgi:catechol 2,3-dioxygenase-like lactoylglutathione lyase family enzyme